MVLSIDVQGAKKVRRALGARAVSVFLLPPSMRRLRERLLQRRTDSPAAIRRRLMVARRELACAASYDYRVMNDRLGQTIRTIETIVKRELAKRATERGAVSGWRKYPSKGS